MKKLKNINIPTEWKDISYKKYYELSKLPFSEDSDSIEETYKMVSIACGISISEIESLKAKDYIDIISTLSFMSTPPEIDKGNVSWDFYDVENITMDKYIAFESYKRDVEENISKILKLMDKKKSLEEIENLAVGEVLYGFFMLRNKSEKYIRRLSRSILLMIIKMKVKEKMKMALKQILFLKK